MTYTINIEMTYGISDFWWKFLSAQRRLADISGNDIFYHSNEVLSPYNAKLYRIKRNHSYEIYVDFPSEKEYMLFILRYS